MVSSDDIGGEDDSNAGDDGTNSRADDAYWDDDTNAKDDDTDEADVTIGDDDILNPFFSSFDLHFLDTDMSTGTHSVTGVFSHSPAAMQLFKNRFDQD